MQFYFRKPKSMINAVFFTPYLFAIYPMLFLWSRNYEEVYFSEIILLTITLIIFTYLINKLFYFITKNSYKTSILSSIFLFFTSFYGRIFDDNTITFQQLNKIQFCNIQFFRHRYIIPILILVFILIFHIMYKSKNNFKSTLKFFTTTVLILITINILNLSYNLILKPQIYINLPQTNHNIKKPDSFPNIYYIILDAYGREDVLKNIYQYDNSNFINFLKQKNFFIANKSYSNYARTNLSIPSSMNFDYLKETPGLPCFFPHRYLSNSQVILFLKKQGYKFINISSGYGFTARNKLAAIEMGVRYFSLGNFSQELISTNIFGPLFKYLNKFSILDFIVEKHHNRVLYQFDALKEVPSIPGPFFVFCHILTPHPPYSFDENGIKKEIKPTLGTIEDKNDYLRQLPFINKKVQEVIEIILSNSKNPPIIILQSDHGPGLTNQRFLIHGKGKPSTILATDRMGILNAYYLPEKENIQLYPYKFKIIT